jgi:hypothetical protein
LLSLPYSLFLFAFTSAFPFAFTPAFPFALCFLSQPHSLFFSPSLRPSLLPSFHLISLSSSLLLFAFFHYHIPFFLFAFTSGYPLDILFTLCFFPFPSAFRLPFCLLPVLSLFNFFYIP